MEEQQDHCRYSRIRKSSPSWTYRTRRRRELPAGTPVFDVQNASIYYGAFRAVTDVSLTIHENEITAFIGPSGCGKTTVLRTLNRMNDLIVGARVEGDFRYRGASLYAQRRLADRRQAPHRDGLPEGQPVPQVRSTTTSPTGRASTASATRPSSTRSSSGRCKQAALWDEVKDRLNKSGLGLSGGQAQRLCIARTLAVEPDVVLMDEPCSALDPIATGRIEDLMHEIKSQYTIVIVTHNMQQATRVSDRTAFYSVLRDEKSDTRTGVLVEYGPTAQIFGDPQDERTQAYVTGRMG